MLEKQLETFENFGMNVCEKKNDGRPDYYRMSESRAPHVPPGITSNNDQMTRTLHFYFVIYDYIYRFYFALF